MSFEACPGDRQTKECVTGLTEEQREKSLYAVRHDVTRATHYVSAAPLATWPHSIYGDVAAVDVGLGVFVRDNTKRLQTCFEGDVVHVQTNMIENLIVSCCDFILIY